VIDLAFRLRHRRTNAQHTQTCICTIRTQTLHKTHARTYKKLTNHHTRPKNPQVVDLGLPPGSRVLGAALLQQPCGPAAAAAAAAGNGGDPGGVDPSGGGGGGEVRLLVLTESEVVAFKLA
jgi:hypothetical protein